MRRIALVSLTMLGGCGYHTWWNPPFSTGYSPNAPVSDSVNMSRVRGNDVAVRPLTTEPGDIWPGPLPPPKTLQDLEQEAPTGAQAPAIGSPLNRAGNPLLAPVPGGTPGAAPNTSPGGTTTPGGTTPGGTTTGGTTTGGTTPATPQGDRRIVVPNGNGTSTVIYPDGRIETIPTPK